MVIIWDFKDYRTGVLEEALELYKKLESIGFEVNEDELREIKSELEDRKN